MNWNELESLVRKLGRIKWQTNGGSENIGGSQIDGVFRTAECTHLVEVTIERSMQKVRDDVNKLIAAKRHEEGNAFLVDCWMVMSVEPTPDQRSLAHSSKVRLVTIDEFLEPILCKEEYLYLRPRYFFGSVGDPAGKDSADLIVRYPTPMNVRKTGKDVSVETLADRVLHGESVVLLGDFGAGKSLALREIFRYLDKKSASSHQAFPVAINLREHWGQVFGTEMVSRHAELIGSQNGAKIYLAAREGFITFLLDGFDELAPQPWAYDNATLQNIRKQALAAVRHLMETKPNKSGVVISGRSHYFASENELCEALGLPIRSVTIVDLRELTDSEAQEFLQKHGVSISLSSWLPKRPLFLSYLARTGYTNEFADIADENEVGIAWRRILEMVCEREAKVSLATQKQTVLDILCRLAHDMRTKSSKLGPITDQDLEQAFRKVTGHQPDHDAWAILQRLPGITFRSEGQKWFVDEEWADALAGSAVAKIVLGILEHRPEDAKTYSALGSLGRMVSASELESAGKRPKDLVTWSHTAVRDKLDPTIVSDCVAICDQMSEEKIDFRDLTVSGALCGEYDFVDTNLENLKFEHCVFDLVSVSETPPSNIRLHKSLIEELDGVSRKDDIPAWLPDCEVSFYRFPNTNAEVMKSSLPDKIKAGIMVLRKTFLQAGRGRKMSALIRGIRPDSTPIVQAVIRELEKEGYIFIRGGDPIVHAVRSRAVEVRQMLAKNPDPSAGLWMKLMNAK